MAVTGINHVVLKVRDLEQSDAFYRGVLGLEKFGERGRMWFYTAGAHHHDLVLLEVGQRGTPPPRGSLGLFHFCFDVPDEQTLASMCPGSNGRTCPIPGPKTPPTLFPLIANS
jgi:catechol 2,3-dioxygenase